MLVIGFVLAIGTDARRIPRETSEVISKLETLIDDIPAGVYSTEIEKTHALIDDAEDGRARTPLEWASLTRRMNRQADVLRGLIKSVNTAISIGVVILFSFVFMGIMDAVARVLSVLILSICDFCT
jgi:hypothetical protein